MDSARREDAAPARARRKLLAFSAIVFAVLVLAALVVPLLVPFDAWKPQIIAKVKEVTGRDLRVDGPMRLSVFPRVALELEDVGFSSAPGSGFEEIVTVQELRLVLRLVPLLSGNLEIATFVLDQPVIVLETDKNGRSNWIFGDNAAKSGEKSGPALPSAPLLFSLGDARIADGRITWIDRRSSTEQHLQQINLKVALPSLDKPLEIEGDLKWNEKKIAIDLEVTRPRLLIDGSQSKVALEIESEAMSLRYRGEVTSVAPVHAEGLVEMTIPSVRGFASWIGSPIHLPGQPLRPAHLEGKLALAGSKATFTDTEIAFDEIEAKGNLRVDASGETPRLDGKLAVGEFDLASWISPETSPSTGAGTKPGDDGLDLTGLQALDADLALTVATITAGGITVKNTACTADLQDGRLAIELASLTAYEGNGRGKVVVDATSAESARIAVSLHLDGFDAEPLLRDAAGFDQITGKGVLDASIATRGRTARELIQTIQGKGRLDMSNGAIKGINLVAMVLHVASAFTVGDANATTEFSQMGGSFTIANGVLENDDMAMKSPLLHVQGAGQIDLFNRTVDYRISPKVVTPLVGELGLGSPGVMVPVLVRGPWDHVRVSPDMAGLIQQGFTAPIDVVEGVVKLPEALYDRARGKEAPKDEAPAESAPSRTLDKLKGLFGR